MNTIKKLLALTVLFLFSGASAMLNMKQSFKQIQQNPSQSQSSPKAYMMIGDQEVKSYNMDPLSRELLKIDPAIWLDKVSFKVGQLDNGDLTVHAFAKGVGGGWLGAAIGTVVGFVAVRVVYEGAALGAAAAVTAYSGPTGGMVAYNTIKSVGDPLIIQVQKDVAIATGIALGAATGPL